MIRTGDRISRRRFVGGVAAGALTLTTIGCDAEITSPAEPGPSEPDAEAGRDATMDRDAALPGNGAPVWMAIPTIQFVQGTPASFSIAPYVSDPDGDELALTLNDVPLPAGVTFDASAMEFVYDGVGPVGTTSGHMLTADDGA
ncbi:MAG: putative Ig domain-containing protein [Myxococcota bacterium]